MNLWQAYRSEWVKLRRPTILIGTWATSFAFAVLTSVLLLSHLSKGANNDPQHTFTLALLDRPSGLVYGLTEVVGLLGVIAIVVCTFTLASEYSQGTLRTVLVRQPRRLTWLLGAVLALMSLIVIATVLATLGAVAASLLVASHDGISTAQWSAGAVENGLLDTAGAMIGYGLFGCALAILLRSPVAAIGLAVAWFLPIEGILTATVDGASRWLPGQQLQVIATHTTPSLAAVPSIDHALLVVGGYIVILAGAAALSFIRRDVLA
jgi:ABC-2 type transport system permease protein